MFFVSNKNKGIYSWYAGIKNIIQVGINLKIVLFIQKKFSKMKWYFKKFSHPSFFANGEVLLQTKQPCI
jgi:hypothetical protein